jgi:ABC-type polysaccharide/polyol phosphate export permease
MLMKQYQINSSMRFFFLVAGLILWAGIWLTGFNSVHWLLYMPPAFFLIAAVTGICPGMIFANSLFGKRGES